jgi:hypothetical protein
MRVKRVLTDGGTQRNTNHTRVLQETDKIGWIDGMSLMNESDECGKITRSFSTPSASSDSKRGRNRGKGKEQRHHAGTTSTTTINNNTSNNFKNSNSNDGKYSTSSSAHRSSLTRHVLVR